MCACECVFICVCVSECVCVRECVRTCVCLLSFPGVRACMCA